MTEQERQIIKEWEDAYNKARGNEVDCLFDYNHILTIFIKPEFIKAAKEAVDEEDWDEEMRNVRAGVMPSFQWDDPVSDEAFVEWLAEFNFLEPEWIDSWSMDG